LRCRYATLAAKDAADSVQAKAGKAQAATSQQQQQQQAQEQQGTPSQQQQQDKQAPGSPYTPESVGLCSPGAFEQQLQIVGMSATLPNVDQVARWLDALLYKTSFRPVHLKQWVKVDRTLQDANGQVNDRWLCPSGSFIVSCRPDLEQHCVWFCAPCHMWRPAVVAKHRRRMQKALS
jgi:hypothetical protein